MKSRFALFAASLLFAYGLVLFFTPAHAEDPYVVNLYVDTVTEQQVRDALTAAGYESFIRLSRVDVVETGLTAAVVGGSCVSACIPANAAIQVTDDNFLATPNFSLGHEYGHVWANYWAWTNWQGSYNAYLEARGLLGDDRVGSTGCWTAAEMIAEDYRRLFGAGEALTLAECNRYIPLAENVPGLRNFLALTWTNGHPPPNYGGTVPSTSTPTITLTPVATSTPVNTPIARPTVCNVKGKGCH